MSYASHLQGIGSGATYPADTVMNLCPVDNRPVEIVLDIDRLKAEKPDFAWYSPDRKNMWRFGGLLALDYDDESDRPFISTLGEGHTPLLPYPDHPLAESYPFKLYVKDEGKPHPGFGANPTNSFKDRGMAMVVSMAKKLDLTKLAVPTQGNAGDSLSEYGLRHGLEIAVVMPDTTPMPIMGKVAAYSLLHPNIHLDLVQGTVREAGQVVREKYVPQGYFSVATFQEPGWRIEGKKTMGLELAEPIPGIKENWSLPDVILYPTGGGTGILGMWKAFRELEALGVISDKRPKLIAVQSQNTAPLVNALEQGKTEVQPVTAGETIATGLNVPGGVGHFKILEILKQSGGGAIAVSDEAISQELSRSYQQTGWWICPEGAACFAALSVAIERGYIQPNDEVVVFNTGSFEKYLPNIRHLLAYPSSFN